MSPLPTKMYLKSSLATAELANHWIYPLTPSVASQPSHSSTPHISALLTQPWAEAEEGEGQAGWQKCSLNGSSSQDRAPLAVTLQNHTPLIKAHFYTTNKVKENFVCCHPGGVQSLAY